MKAATSIFLGNNISLDEIKNIIIDTFKAGDKIHISKNSKLKLKKAPAIFKGVYNHFISVEAPINDSYTSTFTITFSDLYTGDTVIHELLEKLDLSTN